MKELQELMTVIGKKRFIFLVVVLSIALAMAGLWQKVLLPQQEDLTSSLSQVQAERTKLQTQMRELPDKLAGLQKNEQRYDDLEKTGIFMPQDRIEARTRIDTLRQKADLRGLDYKMEPQSVIDTPTINTTNNQLVMTKISVEMRSLTDHEVFRFLDSMQHDFKGLVLLKDLKLTRKEDVNPPILNRLKLNGAVDMITANASFEWYNISPKIDDKNAPLNKAFQGSAK